MGSKVRPARPVSRERQHGFKDWKPGEARIKAEIISPSGAKYEMTIPHLSDEAGGYSDGPT